MATSASDATKSMEIMSINNIAYWGGEEASDYHKLNIFMPKSHYAHIQQHRANLKAGDNTSHAVKHLPVAMHIHGGGWARGDRAHYFYGAPFMGEAYAKKGMLSIVISYRRNQQHPAHIEDVARAVRWIVDNVEREYLGDVTNRFFISGHSAGAHLATLLLMNQQFLRAENIDPRIIKAVIAISGIYDLPRPMEAYDMSLKNILFRRVYLRRAFGDDPQLWQTASPIHYVERVLDGSEESYVPPFLFINAEQDLSLNLGAERFIARLRGEKVEQLESCSTTTTTKSSYSDSWGFTRIKNAFSSYFTSASTNDLELLGATAGEAEAEAEAEAEKQISLLGDDEQQNEQNSQQFESEEAMKMEGEVTTTTTSFTSTVTTTTKASTTNPDSPTNHETVEVVTSTTKKSLVIEHISIPQTNHGTVTRSAATVERIVHFIEKHGLLCDEKESDSQ